jgi:hypothetical protein
MDPEAIHKAAGGFSALPIQEADLQYKYSGPIKEQCIWVSTVQCYYIKLIESQTSQICGPMCIRIKVNATCRIKRGILTKTGIELEVQNLGGITISHSPLVCMLVIHTSDHCRAYIVLVYWKNIFYFLIFVARESTVMMKKIYLKFLWIFVFSATLNNKT